MRGFVWNTLYALRLVLVISQTAPARALPTSFIHSEVYNSYMANTGSLVLVWETNAVKPSVCLPKKGQIRLRSVQNKQTFAVACIVKYWPIFLPFATLENYPPCHALPRAVP